RNQLAGAALRDPDLEPLVLEAAGTQRRGETVDLRIGTSRLPLAGEHALLRRGERRARLLRVRGRRGACLFRAPRRLDRVSDPLLVARARGPPPRPPPL